MSILVNLRTRLRRIARELAKFGSIGALAFVITFALFNLCLHRGVGPMTSNALATVTATTFAYFANRYWTFRHREHSGLGREYLLFFALNGIGLVITQAFVGFGAYVLHQKGMIASNLALVIGTGVATVFRFWAYRKWVFLPPAPVVQQVQAPAAFSRASRTTSASGAVRPGR